MAGLTLCPPFRPASAANLRFCEKLRFSFGTLSPPFRAIARCFSRSMEAKPRVEVGDFLGISIGSVIVSSLELRHCRKSEMFGRDKGFKWPNLRWTAPGFQVIKGIIHAPCAKPALRPESRDALLTAISKARGWINDIRLGRIPARAGVARAFLECGARGAGAVVGYGRGVPAERGGFALWRRINPDKTGCTSQFLSVRHYSRDGCLHAWL